MAKPGRTRDKEGHRGQPMRATLFAGIGYLLLFGAIAATVALWHGFAAAPSRPAAEAALDLKKGEPPRASLHPRKAPFD